MAKDQDILNVQLIFRSVKNSANYFPPIVSLSESLNVLVGGDKTGTKQVDGYILKAFAAASVEMWQRAVHSFLISASLTDASPIWSSVAGYYSSHYTMRALAHSLGYFQLHTKKVIVHLDLSTGGYHCDIVKKNGDSREHRLYWSLVRQNKYFANDPFFYENIDSVPPPGTTEFKSDGGHRNRANYGDLVGGFPVFRPLDESSLRRRVEAISGMLLSDVPIPNVYEYPDLDSVQLLAYHRIVKYRAFLDQALSATNRFWTAQREPSWTPKYFDFQIVGADYSQLLASLMSSN